MELSLMLPPHHPVCACVCIHTEPSQYLHRSSYYTLTEGSASLSNSITSGSPVITSPLLLPSCAPGSI